MNTLALIILFIFGILCAWGILKATNWLPLILVMCTLSARAQSCTGGSCNHDVFWRNSSAGTICVNQTCSGPATCSSCPANIGQSIAPGQTICFGENNTGDTYNYFVYAGGVCSGTPVCTQAGSGGTTAVTWVYPGCTNLPPTYYWNYCITNNSGLPMQVMWVGSPNNSPLVNLGPGQYYCFSGSGTTWGFGGFTEAYYNPDGTATNISIWPPTAPNGTNNVPGNSGGYNPGGPGGPGNPQGPGGSLSGSNTNLTGNQYYAGVSNLQSTLANGFGYLGSLIGAEDTQIQMGNGLLLSISNGVLTMVGAEGTNNAQNSVMTNQFSAVTNQLAALTNGGFSLLSSNLGTLNSNTVAGFSNLLAALGGTNSPFPSGGDTNRDQVSSNAGYMSNSVVVNWGAPYDYGGATDIISGSSNSYWFLNINTNPFTGSPGVKGIDLDPRHSAWFTGFASYAKNIEVWVITLAVMWQIRVWMSKRLMAVLMTPGPSVGGGEVSSMAIMIAKAAGGTAIVASLPLMMAAAAYNFLNWPSYTTASHPLGATAVYSLAGSVGPYIADAIDIVGYMVPLGFLGGALVYLGVVWLALDAMVVGVMTRVRFYPF